MTREFKVGFLFVTALGLATVFAVMVRPDWRGQGDLAVSFARVARLKQGDAVTYNGVRVGQITDVQPVLDAGGTASVSVRFSVEKRFRQQVLIGPETQYHIVQGVLGGATIDIRSHAGQPITAEIMKDARGSDPASIDDAILSVQRMVDENRAEIRKAIAAIRVGADNLGGMAGEIKDAVGENRPNLRTAIKNLGDASGTISATVAENRESLRAAIDNIRVMADQAGRLVAENRDQVKAAVANMSRAGGEIAAAVQENRENLKQITDSIARFGPRLERIGENLEVITGQISRGQGTIGKLVMDDRLHNSAVEMVENANQRIEEVKPWTQGLTELKFYGGLDGGMNFSRGVAIGTGYLRIEPRPWKYYEFGASYRTAPTGVYPAPEDPDKLNIDFEVLLGWRFFRDDQRQRYRLDVAGGLIESQIGGRVSTPLPGTDNFAFTLMARHKQNNRQPTDRRYESGKVLGLATVSYRIWERVYVSAGCYDCFERPGFYGGLRGEILDRDLRNIFAGAVLLK